MMMSDRLSQIIPAEVTCTVKDYPFADDADPKRGFTVNDRYQCVVTFYARVAGSGSSALDSLATFGHSFIGLEHWYSNEVRFGLWDAGQGYAGVGEDGDGVVLEEPTAGAGAMWDCRLRFHISEDHCRQVRNYLEQVYNVPPDYDWASNNCGDFVKEVASQAGNRDIANFGSLEGIDTPGELCDAIRGTGRGEFRPQR